MRDHDPDSSAAADAATVAAHWLARRLDAARWTERDEAEWRAWCDASIRNEEAFRHAEAALAEMSRPEAFPPGEIAAVLRHRRAAKRAHCVSLPRRFVPVIAGGLAALALVLMFAVKRVTWTHEFSTAIAERREVELPDGSRVHLDALTRLACVFDSANRRVRLLSGRATFLVTPDAARPFEVLAASRSIRVVGTFFEVGLEPGGDTPLMQAGTVHVAVSKGIVSLRTVDAAGNITENLRLTAGKQVTWPADQLLPRLSILSEGSFATWRENRLRYHDEALAVIVRDLQRYFPGHIALADPSLAGLRVTGTLHSDDPAAACDLLRDILPVRVRHPDAMHIVIERDPAHVPAAVP
jgi:transmembrane sensor